MKKKIHTKLQIVEVNEIERHIISKKDNDSIILFCGKTIENKYDDIKFATKSIGVCKKCLAQAKLEKIEEKPIEKVQELRNLIYKFSPQKVVCNSWFYNYILLNDCAYLLPLEIEVDETMPVEKLAEITDRDLGLFQIVNANEYSKWIKKYGGK